MTDKKQLQLAIGKRIKKLREQREIPQQDLAAKCNLEKSNLSRLEAGGTNPTIYTLLRIADSLDVSLCDIVTLDLKD
ncbi:helix-turn-helix domain-containing protein [Tenacibaculum aquimarinum]|uniref:helix-turn-helix domain-containing protein n=1 Tax=Tenacibaculum aquimarinum TaxID=2910675 RepID=UPI001F0ADC6F|nr:helix-turn-helix transcriptional regulator [Tenacibaculum aquimarinum]MCH3883496.1 helix-turn-helix domain-containing protein [Tenacibaculum aquimarinum]